ncbi:MAG: hypothetical protein ACPLKS_04810 [Caldisericum exile]|uniref:hypothetical protein n=1 Tax=Caldisericum exile TaxID=693075 RepID=UPI003C794025
MGLKDMKCDSCGGEFNFLFPIAVTEELPTGGFTLVVKYYCIKCYDLLMEESEEEAEDEREDGDESEPY